MTDYLAMETVSKDDAVQYGVPGMKWGRRRSRAALSAAAAQRKDAPSKDAPAGEHKKVVGAASGETSSARYNRLAAQAKSGRASDMDEQDLKFFNARTEALSKINKLNETDPGWLSKTTKKVLQTTAERQMQNVSDAIASKYISGPVIDSLKSAGVGAEKPSTKD